MPRLMHDENQCELVCCTRDEWDAIRTIIARSRKAVEAMSDVYMFGKLEHKAEAAKAINKLSQSLMRYETI